MAATELVADKFEKSLNGLKALGTHPLVRTDYCRLYSYFLRLR